MNNARPRPVTADDIPIFTAGPNMTPTITDRSPRPGDMVTSGGLARRGRVVVAEARKGVGGFVVQWQGSHFTEWLPETHLTIIDVERALIKLVADRGALGITPDGTGVLVTCEADGIEWLLTDDDGAPILSGTLVPTPNGDVFEVRRGRVEHGRSTGERKRIVGRYRSGPLAHGDGLCTVALRYLAPGPKWTQR